MKIFILLMILSTNILLVATEKEDARMPLKVGDMAPDFKLRDDGGNWRTLSEFEGKKIVVYFYPKDDTPGCTKEACSFRDNYQAFGERGIVVLGINYDSVESHRKFKEKYNLPFILLSDEKKEAASAYGATALIWPKRITFLIGEQRKIVHIFDKVTVTEHADEVLKTFDSKAKNKNVE